MRKTKVLSVRLDLATLQSCFDLCEALGHPTKGASGAIARSLTILLKDLRAKDKLPSYSESDLETLVSQFMAIQTNPTSAISMEKLASLDTDFHPVCLLPVDEGHQSPDHAQIIFDQTEQEEYNALLEEKIREQMKSDEDDLLAQIMID